VTKSSLSRLLRLGFQHHGENLVFNAPKDSPVEWPKQGIAIPVAALEHHPNIVDRVVNKLAEYKQFEVIE